MEMEEKQKVQQQQPEEAEEVEEEEEEEELEEEEEPGMETAGAQQIRGQHEEDDNMEEDSGSERESERERAERELKAERERKKAEVRRRLEEAGRAKKAKKGFLTPERKKKLRKLLMLKATEDLKLQQKKRAEERQKVLNERIPSMPSELANMNDDDLLILAEEFRGRIISLESEIYDLSYMSRMKDFEINELTIAVNDLRGKFVKPTLKRISKTDTQFDKIKKQNQAKVDYRSTLKTREGNKFTLEETDNTCGRVDEMIKRMEKRGSNPAAVPPND